MGGIWHEHIHCVCIGCEKYAADKQKQKKQKTEKMNIELQGLLHSALSDYKHRKILKRALVSVRSVLRFMRDSYKVEKKLL